MTHPDAETYVQIEKLDNDDFWRRAYYSLGRAELSSFRGEDAEERAVLRFDDAADSDTRVTFKNRRDARQLVSVLQAYIDDVDDMV